VKILDFFEDSKYFYVVTEYMDEGDLFDYLKEKDFMIAEPKAKLIFK
jgi:serine/threonine protein kinase